MKIVSNKMGVALTTSRMIAQVFGKRHDHVVRDIMTYIGQGHLAKSDSPESVGEFSVSINGYTDDRGKERSEYLVTEDACMLIVMGYTGAKAMEFKKAYITEFRRMREFLTKREEYMADIDDEREVGNWEDCRIDGFTGILEEVGLL